MRRSCVAVALLLWLDVASGQDARGLGAGCAACHGVDGRAAGMGRPLRSLPRSTLARELRAFRDGGRAGTLMPQIARGYTDPEIDALAQWFAQRPAGAPRPAAAASPGAR